MDVCCEGVPATGADVPKKGATMKTNQIEFAALTPPEQQAWVDFCAKEIARHQDDIDRVAKELAHIKKRYGIEPRSVFVAVWIEVR
jgi:hypothetical protein